MKTWYIILALMASGFERTWAQVNAIPDAPTRVKISQVLNQPAVMVYDSTYRFPVEGVTNKNYKKDSLEAAIALFCAEPDKQRSLFQSDALFSNQKKALGQVFHARQIRNVFIQFASRLSFIHQGLPTVFIKYYIAKATEQHAFCHTFQYIQGRWVIVEDQALSPYSEMFRQLKPAVWAVMCGANPETSSQHKVVKEFLSKTKGPYNMPDLYNMRSVLHTWQANQLTNKLIYITDK